ncbi:MAG: NAD(P)-dependent alcohol dehydrogenase, partial [Chloroflexota bacterium]
LMKAVVRTKSKLTVKEVKTPTPGNQEILIRVHAATVTSGDLFMHQLPRAAFVAISLLGLKYKPTPGHEFSGVVEAIGEDVTRFKVGDAVFGTTTGLSVGSNAEYLCLPESWKNGVIAPKPANLSFTEAAALPVGAMTAMYFLKKVDVKPDQQVLVYGASGSVGSYAVQIAKRIGAKVTAVCSTRNVDLVTSLGADEVIDYKTSDFAESGTTYDVIFDAVGKTTSQQRKRTLKQEGRFVTIRSIAGETEQVFQDVLAMAEGGHIKPLIDRCYGLDEITDAYQYVDTGRKKGNVVINVAS